VPRSWPPARPERSTVVAIDPPVRGFLSADTRTAVTVVAARPQGPDFLVVRADALEWVAQAAVRFDAEETAQTRIDPVT
jgi:predicted membrane-bound spermidine synthase